MNEDITQLSSSAAFQAQLAQFDVMKQSEVCHS